MSTSHTVTNLLTHFKLKTMNTNLLALAFILFVSTLDACFHRAEINVPGVTKSSFGVLPDGRPVDLYTLQSNSGMKVAITNYGATIVSWTAPDRNGKFEDVVLGCDSLSGYLQGVPYFGATIGRYANRIAKGHFNLDGKDYSLAVNNMGNHLHGGIKGFDKELWTAQSWGTKGLVDLVLTYDSADGEEGYPGNLHVEVRFSLSGNSLSISYSAKTNKETIVNLTNHTYFNLAGKGDILDHELKLISSAYLPVDSTLIPTGEIRPVKNTNFDFSNPVAIGERIHDNLDEQLRFGGGYDHCWLLDNPYANLIRAAKLYDPSSGRELEMFTSEPAIQFYSGNFLDGSVTGKGGVKYKYRSGLCLEPEHYPDSPNHPEFPSTVLKPGETYGSTTVYTFTVRK